MANDGKMLKTLIEVSHGLLDLVEEKGLCSDHNLVIFHYMKQAIEKLDQVIYEINDAAKVQK